MVYCTLQQQSQIVLYMIFTWRLCKTSLPPMNNSITHSRFYNTQKKEIRLKGVHFISSDTLCFLRSEDLSNFQVPSTLFFGSHLVHCIWWIEYKKSLTWCLFHFILCISAFTCISHWYVSTQISTNKQDLCIIWQKSTTSEFSELLL